MDLTERRSDSEERESQGGSGPVDTRTFQELQDAIADLREEQYRMQEDRQTNYSRNETIMATAPLYLSPRNNTNYDPPQSPGSSTGVNLRERAAGGLGGLSPLGS